MNINKEILMTIVRNSSNYLQDEQEILKINEQQLSIISKELTQLFSTHSILRQSGQFNFKKGDYLTYIGGSGTKYLEKGEKYRTTWDKTNSSGRVAIIGIDKKRLVMPIRFFTI